MLSGTLSTTARFLNMWATGSCELQEHVLAAKEHVSKMLHNTFDKIRTAIVWGKPLLLFFCFFVFVFFFFCALPSYLAQNKTPWTKLKLLNFLYWPWHSKYPVRGHIVRNFQRPDAWIQINRICTVMQKIVLWNVPGTNVFIAGGKVTVERPDLIDFVLYCRRPYDSNPVLYIRCN